MLLRPADVFDPGIDDIHASQCEIFGGVSQEVGLLAGRFYEGGRRSGLTMLMGMPGSPPPLPTSASLRPPRAARAGSNSASRARGPTVSGPDPSSRSRSPCHRKLVAAHIAAIGLASSSRRTPHAAACASNSSRDFIADVSRETRQPSLRKSRVCDRICQDKLLSQQDVSRETRWVDQEGETMTLRPSPEPSLSVVTFGLSER